MVRNKHNTPVIIKYPFWRAAAQEEDAKEVRERAETERENAIQKRREGHEEQERRIVKSRNGDTDTASISESGKAA